MIFGSELSHSHSIAFALAPLSLRWRSVYLAEIVCWISHSYGIFRRPSTSSRVWSCWGHKASGSVMSWLCLFISQSHFLQSLIWDTVRNETRCFGHIVCVRSFWEFVMFKTLRETEYMTSMKRYCSNRSFRIDYHFQLAVLCKSHYLHLYWNHHNIFYLFECLNDNWKRKVRKKRIYEQTYHCFQNCFFFWMKDSFQNRSVITVTKVLAPKYDWMSQWHNEAVVK